jgi:hypothetical protein
MKIGLKIAAKIARNLYGVKMTFFTVWPLNDGLAAVKVIVHGATIY